MEFADLGEHCSVSLCKQKDFLPFKCDCCKKVFCLEHRSYRQHNCEFASNKDHRVVICPLCAASVHFNDGADVHQVFDAHMAQSCKPELRKSRTTVNRCQGGIDNKVCREKLSLSNSVTCSNCKKKLCLSHRHTDAHVCKLEVPSNTGFLGKIRSLFSPNSPTSSFSVKSSGSSSPKKAFEREKKMTPQEMLRETANRRMRS